MNMNPSPTPEAIQFCEECNFPLSQCGPQDAGGEPSMDCKVCQLRERVAELEKDKAMIDWLEEQAKASYTGISFDWCRHVEDGQVVEHGFRFMRRHFLGERKLTLRAAISKVMESKP